MEENVNQQMIDTTDSLEAVSVMKGMKNLLFWLLLLALVASQGVFWLHRLGLVEKDDELACGAAGTVVCDRADGQQRLSFGFAAPVPLTAHNTISEQVERIAQEVGLDADDDADQADIDPDAPPENGEPVVEPDPLEEPEEPARTLDLNMLRMHYTTAGQIVCAANFVMFIAAVLYCLTLLMNLKISLTGKLGGINHISRAFFNSLFLLVFLTPWQVILPGVVLGAMYMPAELLCGRWAGADASGLWTILFYLRFTGYWLLVVWLLLCAQSRTLKWSRATLRRLGMTR